MTDLPARDASAGLAAPGGAMKPRDF